MSDVPADGARPVTPERAEAVYRSLLALDLADTTTTVCLASMQGKAKLPTFETLQLARDLEAYFRGLLAQLLRGLSERDRVLRSYAAGSMLERHEIEYLSLPEHPQINEQIEALGSLADLGLFRRDRKFVANLRFYAIVLQREGAAPLFFFRSYSPKQQLARSRFIAAWFHQDRYDLLRDDVLLFDREIDSIVYDDMVFILDKRSFERIFRFFELIQERAEEMLVEVQSRFTTRVRSSGFEAFAESCKRDVRKLAKLNRVAAMPYLGEIDMVAIKRVVESHARLAPLIGTEGGEEILLFDATDAWTVLRLLDDDYLESMMTGKPYEANSKRPI